jgi:hypothetical protein
VIEALKFENVSGPEVKVVEAEMGSARAVPTAIAPIAAMRLSLEMCLIIVELPVKGGLHDRFDAMGMP